MEMTNTQYQLKNLRERIEKTCEVYNSAFNSYKQHPESRETTILGLDYLGKELSKIYSEVERSRTTGPKVVAHEGRSCLQVLSMMPEEIAKGDKTHEENYLTHALDQLDKLRKLTPLIEMEMINLEMIQKNSYAFDGTNIIDKEIRHYQDFLKRGNLEIIPEYQGKKMLNTYNIIFQAVISTMLGDAINNSPMGTEEEKSKIKLDLGVNKNSTYFKIVNPYKENQQKNFPKEIGMGMGIGGKFLEEITKATHGNLLREYSKEKGEFLAQITIPNKYVQNLEDRLKGKDPKIIDRLNSLRQIQGKQPLQ
jgi:hypothetical protein